MNTIITNKTQGTGNDTFTVAADSANIEAFDITKYVNVIVDKDLMASIKVTLGTFLDSVDDVDGNNNPVEKMLGVYSYYKNVLVPCNDITSTSDKCGISGLYYMHNISGRNGYIMYNGNDNLSPKKAFAILNGNVPAIDQYNNLEDRQKLANAFYKGDKTLNDSKIVWFDPYGGNQLSEYCMFIPDKVLQNNGETENLQRRTNHQPITDSATSPRLFIRGVRDNSNILPDITYTLFNNKAVASSSTIPADVPYKNHIYLAIGKAMYNQHPYFVNSLKFNTYTNTSQTPLSYFEEISAMKYTIIGLMKYHLNFYYNDTKLDDISDYIDSITPTGSNTSQWCGYQDLTKVVDNKRVCDDIYTMLSKESLFPKFLVHAFNMKDGYTIEKVERTGNYSIKKMWPATKLSGGEWSSINGVSITNRADASWYNTNEDGSVNYNELNSRVAGITKYSGAYSNRVDVSLGCHDVVGPVNNVGVAAVDQDYISAENNYARSLGYTSSGKIHDGYVVPTENSAYEIPTITVNIYIVDEE